MLSQNKYVYHYCSVETFLSIIQNSCLWMGNIRHSNDLTERVPLINALCRQLTDAISPNLSSSDSARLREIITQFQEDTQGICNPCYATCFSFQPDLLSQWRGYADNGAGVAIGFHGDYFISCSSQLRALLARPIEYLSPNGPIPDSIKNLPSFELHFQQVTDLIQEVIQIPFDHPDFPMAYEQYKHFSNLITKIQSYFEEFLYPSIFYKSIAFQEEAEFRLAFSTSADLREVDDTICAPDFSAVFPDHFSISSAKFRYARGQLQPYCEFSFAPRKQSIIGEIRLGPKCTLKASDIYYLLAMNGYLPNDPIFPDRYSTRNIQIIPSSVPYC